MRSVRDDDDDGVVVVVGDRAIGVAGVGVDVGVGIASVAAGTSPDDGVERVRGVRRARRERGQDGAGGGERERTPRVDGDALRRGRVRRRDARHRR